MLDGLGELPAGWIWAPLGDLVEVLDSQREPIRQQDRDRRCVGKQASQLFPYYGATGQVGWIDGFRSEGPSILLGEDGAPFLDRYRPKAYPVDGRYWVNNHAHLLKPRDARYFDLIWHQLNYVDYEGSVSGTTRLKLTLDALRRIPIVAPPADEAERIGVEIGKLFTELDEAEAALARARASLAEYRASLLHAACTGQLTAAWRASRPHPAEDGPALLCRILAERRAAWECAELARLTARSNAAPKADTWKNRYREPQALDADGLPGLPEGWIWTALDQLITDGPTNGYSPTISDDDRGTMSLKLTATTQGRLDLSERAIKRLSETLPPSSPLFLKRYDLLFQRGNTPEYVGIAAVFSGPENTFIYPDLMIRVRTSEPMLTHWLWRVANSPWGRSYMRANAGGTAGSMPKINSDVLRRLPVPLPPWQEMGATLDIVAACEAETLYDDGLAQHRAQSGQLRQSILHAAFTGRLVPQNPADEPAAALLARLRDAPLAPRRTRKQARAA